MTYKEMTYDINWDDYLRYYKRDNKLKFTTPKLDTSAFTTEMERISKTFKKALDEAASHFTKKLDGR